MPADHEDSGAYEGEDDRVCPEAAKAAAPLSYLVAPYAFPQTCEDLAAHLGEVAAPRVSRRIAGA